jgi:prenylated cyclic peptide (anacyclamide/piricyclamide family)
MTKKNLKPQQAAPVQREINTTSSEGGTGLTPNQVYLGGGVRWGQNQSFCGRRCGVIPLILTLTSKSVKSLFLSPLAHG